MNNKQIDTIDRVKEVRRHLGLSSKDFAAKAGVDPSNYSSIETRKRSFGNRVMGDICDAFNVNIGWLMTGEGEMFEENSKIPARNSKISVIRFWADIEATGGNAMAFDDGMNGGYVEMVMPNFSGCTDAITIYGDSMYPRYKSGQVIVLRPWNESYVEFGQAYLIITRTDYRMVKYLFPAQDSEKLSCVSENKASYPTFEIDKEDIHKLFIVKGVIEQHLV